MMKTNITIGVLIGLVVVLTGATFFEIKKAEERYNKILIEGTQLGAFRPSNYVGKLLTRLDEGGSESTFNTTPGTAADGSTLTTAKIGDFLVFTINPGADNEEKISASAVSVSGTTATWTIINRGLSFTENVAVTANKKAHAVGETVIISNDDQYLSQQYIDVDQSQSIIGIKTFTNGALFATAASSTDECFANTEYCTKSYIDNSVNQGAATSTENNGGISQLATQLQQASSTDLGASIPLVLQAKYATSSPNGSIASRFALVLDTAGTIATTAFNAAYDYIWTGNWTFNGGGTATTTFNRGVDIDADADTPFILNGLSWIFPSSGDLFGGRFVSNGNGTLSIKAGSERYSAYKTDPLTVTNASGVVYATSTSFSFAAGQLTASSTIRVSADTDWREQTGDGSATLSVILKAIVGTPTNGTYTTLATCTTSRNNSEKYDNRQFTLAQNTAGTLIYNCVMSEETSGLVQPVDPSTSTFDITQAFTLVSLFQLTPAGTDDDVSHTSIYVEVNP